MQQIYRRKPVPKCDFNKVAKQLYFEIAHRHGCSPVNLLHIFRTPKNTSGRLLLRVEALSINFTRSFMNIIHRRIWFCRVKHPNKWAVTELSKLDRRFFFCLYKTFEIFYKAPDFWEALLQRVLLWFSILVDGQFVIQNQIQVQTVENHWRYLYQCTWNDIVLSLESYSFHRLFT